MMKLLIAAAVLDESVALICKTSNWGNTVCKSSLLATTANLIDTEVTCGSAEDDSGCENDPNGCVCQTTMVCGTSPGGDGCSTMTACGAKTAVAMAHNPSQTIAQVETAVLAQLQGTFPTTGTRVLGMSGGYCETDNCNAACAVPENGVVIGDITDLAPSGCGSGAEKVGGAVALGVAVILASFF